MEAKYYKKTGGDVVQCLLCPHLCRIAPGKAGLCRVRRNSDGILEALSYGQVVALAMDPIEKKPLFHFHPGKQILSTGPNGCNLDCQFCQNWEISQQEVPTEYVEPQKLVDLAAKSNSIGLAYTYTEPFIWFEYLLDACRLAHEKGLVNVLVTNGTVNREPLEELLPLIDAMNIDLKSMDAGFYKKTCRGDLQTVLDTIMTAHGGCHIELTNLVIPGLNDSDQNFDDLVNFVKSVDPLVPLHLSRCFPQYKTKIEPTPESTLIRFYDRALADLKYVYLGNVSLPGKEDTLCPQCGKVLIERRGYRTAITGIKNKNCQNCGRKADIVGL
ncbi:MAG: AmmeMemoRadiSam system radical SAM enzyme [Candidatus Edwardsbacteria bacterium]|nr:AmmeMemoRadiSam system radical SAM enzyme [Candidatus Edwardsbacteria bacterium]